MRIAVIGSNSFTGSHLVDLLLDEGHEVLALSRSLEPSTVFLPYRWERSATSSLQVHALDLNRDGEAIARVLRDFGPDRIANFAAQSMVAQSWEHPDHWYQTNVVAIAKLAAIMQSLPGLRGYLHVSTPEVYGSCEGLLRENTEYQPSTPYATSRAAADMHLMCLHRTLGFPVAFTRAANVFGPGQQLYRIVPRTVASILLGRKLVLDGGGKSVRSFIHVRDVCRGSLAVMERGAPGAIYHLATSRFTSIRDLVELVCTRLGVAFGDVVTLGEERPGKDQAYCLDTSRARTELGWSDQVTLEEGIEETIQWVRSNVQEIKGLPWDYEHRP